MILLAVKLHWYIVLQNLLMLISIIHHKSWLSFCPWKYIIQSDVLKWPFLKTYHCIVGKIHVNYFQGYLLKLFLPKNSVQHFKNTIKGYLEISPHLDNAHAQKWSLGPQRKRLGSAPLPPHPSHWHFRNCVCGLDPWGCPDHKCIVMCTYCLLHIAYCLCILKVTDHIFLCCYMKHMSTYLRTKGG